ncbi:cyclic AMP-responsive element-binding protein 3-like protein 3-B isoform X2 [Antedon mediterranea]|uniref:cyclic AMP-responsive element-binding protein 3-like protein 3-B isoform X2 n=1 Tax=Antedon mediterranea TaxID=105859 RepID=UPI003AF9A86C
MSSEEVVAATRLLSTADELDLLFDINTGILVDDDMISPSNPDFFQLDCKTGLTDDVFNELLQLPNAEIQDHSDILYTTEVCSPVSSDSGISDDQKSPYHSTSEASPVGIEDIPLMDSYQSNASPLGVDEIPASESYLDTFDLSSILTGSDAMLIDGDLITVTTSDGKSTDMAIQFSEPKEPAVKYVKMATDSLPLFIKEDTSSFENIISTDSKKFPALTLTDEEKKLLDDANVALPSHYPLTKDEEKSLKAVRRKIRNKISAQDSRKRKKEYVDGLEQRVQNCTRQNIELRRKMDRIEKENKTLLEQLKDLKSSVSRATSKAVSASTCVMVFLFSFSLLVAPSFNLFKSSPMPNGGKQSVGVVSRTLLGVDETDVSYTTVSPGTVETDDDQQIFWRKNNIINKNVENTDDLEVIDAEPEIEKMAEIPTPNAQSVNKQNITNSHKQKPVVKAKMAEGHILNDDL